MDDRSFPSGRENRDAAGADPLETAQGFCWRAVKEFEVGRYEAAAELLRQRCSCALVCKMPTSC